MDGPSKRKKRSPALVGSKRRANRKNEKFQQKNNTKSGPKTQDIERHFYWVTRGQTNVGFVEQIGEDYRAIDADERGLGTFGSLKAAADAVSAIYEGAQ